jgi:hypothetical protein
MRNSWLQEESNASRNKGMLLTKKVVMTVSFLRSFQKLVLKQSTYEVPINWLQNIDIKKETPGYTSKEYGTMA